MLSSSAARNRKDTDERLGVVGGLQVMARFLGAPRKTTNKPICTCIDQEAKRKRTGRTHVGAADQVVCGVSGRQQDASSAGNLRKHQ